MTPDGPFPILNLSAAPTVKTDPLTGKPYNVYPAAVGVHYKTEPATLAKNKALLTPYVITPTAPLQNVWAGDDPASPKWTVSLLFPDQATADSVLSRVVP